MCADRVVWARAVQASNQQAGRGHIDVPPDGDDQ